MLKLVYNEALIHKLRLNPRSNTTGFVSRLLPPGRKLTRMN